jgi:3-hydroxyacyl-[acyl-carrier-protein] dehydratase
VVPMRFHLIDRIDSWQPNQLILARKLTSAAERIWDSGGAGPVMSRPLVLEALCQAGTWLVMLSTDHRRRAVLLSVGEVTYHADARPGDVLLLEGRVVSISDDAAVLDGTVRAAGPAAGQETVLLTASDIMCALIDAERLDDPAATRRMGAQLTRAGQAA